MSFTSSSVGAECDQVPFDYHSHALTATLSTMSIRVVAEISKGWFSVLRRS